MKIIDYISLFLITVNTIITCTNQTFTPSSAWSSFAQENTLSRTELTRHFMEDCKRDVIQNDHIPNPTHQNTFRIATYNIHLWRPAADALNTPFDYTRHDHFNAIVETIKNIDADILVTEEMLIFDWSAIKKAFENIGYNCSLNSFAQTGDYHGFPFGTMIFSKIKTTKPCLNKIYAVQHMSSPEQQSFIRTVIELPNRQELVLYGTHLDVHDNTEQVRRGQVQELIDYAHKETSACIVAADFNAIRAQDYQYTIDTVPVWRLLNDDHKRRTGFDAPTQALTLFQEHNFSDCFAKADLQSPYYSVWNGTLVDFLWLNKHWNLPIDGCYVYYNSLSDHLPIIMDIQLGEK